MLLVCNGCKTAFVPEENKFKISNEAIWAEFFECPACKRRYKFLWGDAQMKDLINRRKQLSDKIVGRGLSEEDLRGLMEEIESIKTEQRGLLEKYAVDAERLLEQE